MIWVGSVTTSRLWTRNRPLLSHHSSEPTADPDTVTFNPHTGKFDDPWKGERRDENERRWASCATVAKRYEGEGDPLLRDTVVLDHLRVRVGADAGPRGQVEFAFAGVDQIAVEARLHVDIEPFDKRLLR